MKRTARWAGIGAAIGLVLVTIFAVGTMVGRPDHPELPVVLIIGLAWGGVVIGAPAGAVAGAVAALLTRNRATRPGLRGTPPQATPHQSVAPTAAPWAMRPSQEAMATLDAVRETSRQRAPEAIQRAREAARQPLRQGPVPLAPIAPAPIRPVPERVDLSDPERLNRVLARLDGLIGLEAVAEQVRAVAHRVAFEVRRAEALGVERTEVGMHALFLGPPGVGKTEVARIWGEVLCALGLLPTDRVVEVGRQDLVAPHIGETAGKTRAALEKARGGVFFLDEAYALAPRTPQDFGPEAVAELLAYMENNRSDLAVIAAGYEAQTREFLEVNPGLASRFSETITFPAYDAPTLVQITASMAAQGQDTLTDEATATLLRGYQRLVAAPPQGWANARSARQILDGIRTARAARLGAGLLDREAMTTLTDDDVRQALARRYPQAV